MPSSQIGKDNWKELLNKIFEEVYKLKPEICNYGFYREKKAHNFLKPKETYGNIQWKFKGARPLKVVDILPNEVIFILTSSKDGELFGCPNDYRYGFSNKVPKIDFSKCETYLDICQWIKPIKSSVFRVPHRGFCLIWSLSKIVFEEFANICGKCKKEAIFDEDLKNWIKDEVKRYKRFVEKRRRGRKK